LSHTIPAVANISNDAVMIKLVLPMVAIVAFAVKARN
jgi:hypothetical protein